MTENNKHAPTPEKPAKTNPFEGLAEAITDHIPPPDITDDPAWQVLDPEAILGRQMLALDDIFGDVLKTYHKKRDCRFRNDVEIYLPLVLKIQQNCLSTARTLSAMEYMNSLQHLNLRRGLTLPPPPVSRKQKEFGHE